MNTMNSSAVIPAISELQPGRQASAPTAHRTVRRDTPCGESAQPLRVAYIMSRFPKLTETFILFEIKALEEQGVAVEIYPLWRERAAIMHEEAKAYVARAHFRRLLSGRAFRANLQFLLKSPYAYLAALLLGMKANWGSPRYFCGFLAAFPKAVLFAQEMKRKHVTHVHAHFASHPAAAALVIHRLVGIPYSFTAHGSDLHRDVHMLREKVNEAAFVVAISAFNREKIVAECGEDARDKVRIIHCGTDLSAFRPAPQSKQPDKSLLQLGCIGTLHEVKGQRYLLEACRILKDRGVPFRLHFVGDGPDAIELQSLSKQFGLQKAVAFHGSLTRPAVAKLLAEFDLVVAPSVPTNDGRREGIPVALMEAMACGLPVVASRLTGIPELVVDRVNGRLTPPRDSAALADALEELLTHADLRSSWGQAARKTVESRFDLHCNVQELLRELHNLASSNKPYSVPPREVQA